MTWPYQHRTLAEVDADEALAVATLAIGPSEMPSQGLAARIVAIHRTHPDWGATRIAQAVGRNDAYVRSVAQRRGLSLPRSKPGDFPSAGRDFMRAKRARARA